MTSNDFPLGGDLRVNRMGLGAMRLVLGRGVPDPDTAVALLRRSAELGVNHIDTAGFYGFGEHRAHELIRRALSPYPDDLVIATKVGPVLEGFGPTGQARPDQLRGLVQEDLRRLGLDRLDLVYLRAGGMGKPGGEPVGERFAALAELRREGLIRHLGLSHVDAVQLTEAQSIAPVVAVQNEYHIHRRDDAAVLARCEQAGLAYVPYFPLGGGGTPVAANRLANIAARHGASTAQVALAWLLASSPVTLAIPGTGSLDHLTENVVATGLHLTTDDLAELAE
jgi:aryl-alcohol dehydrogenase-like predicted oxidoreductase